MLRNLLLLAVFALGLLAVCWIGAGYVGSNPLGAAVAALIGLSYLAGALELYRYRQATATLSHAVTELSAAPASLASWLERLHPSVRNATRLRIEGERAALPVPALTPYLVGLLVLLGMLGTLLGMMATLRGTGMALESATDLQAMRGSLAAPVKGLGFAFGTSIAGVASSAMLGLLSALCRRERLQAVQRLDAQIAGVLRVFSRQHQRDEAFRLLQQQTELMPALVERLQSMMTAIEQHSAAGSERQLASHEAFHARTEATYTRLAASVEASLKDSVAESARAASSALQPIMASTMQGIARETSALHEHVAQAVQQQLGALTAGFETATANVSGLWNEALAEQRRNNEAVSLDLRHALDQFAGSFEQRSSGLIDQVSAQLQASTGNMAESWKQALSQQQNANDELAARSQQAWASAAHSFDTQAAALVQTVDRSHAQWQSTLAAGDEERLSRWTQALDAIATRLSQQWQQSGEHAAAQQREICDTLARTASEMSAQSQAHAGQIIAEISHLVQAASEAPRAAAEVVAELRQKLSESMVRDTAMLEERSRLLATLETLLDAVNHASTEQREAVNALVVTSADLLERVSTRFTDHIEAETGKLGSVAAQLTSSAVEVASLGDAFGAAVQMFGQSNQALMERLELIAAALDKSLVRSDEQLAYYVAQAREVIDLSMLSQKQIIEDMQQLASQRAPAGTEPA